ncbi:OstA-like protein [Lutibacter flavus]|uniref:OstA-like protein n=1 Tax=Lutibacter flavus TaxID=691689 RepID=A0A238VPS5_9FLAO|nr:OstA-like protein [Lutibacter flavus]SNR36171.1 OstA-like protein [Lutibacter flavus]
MKKIIIIIIALITIQGFSQSKRIKILKADNTFIDERFPGATISTGNVFVEHEGATLRCDKAYIYQEEKLIKAMGNVIINQGDTIIQYSKYVDYDSNKKVATSWGDVILKDEFMTLKTDTLYFDRVEQHLFYKSGGTIKDTTNLLKSREGNYYLRTNKFQAFKKVDVTNKDSKLISDHLDYFTSTGIAELFGPSTITSAENSIYTEKGHHNSKTNISHFLKNSKILYGDRTIKGDSLYYNKNIEYASATGNISVLDTTNSTIIRGGYAEFFKLKDSVYITDKAVAVSAMENDSIYIHGDKLMVTGEVENRVIKAFRRVKIFKSDIQGKCDSLVSDEKTGLTKLYTNPVLWAEGSQITGDTIHFLSNQKTEQLDSLKVLNNALMVQKDSSGYSQLKGKNMYGKFKNNNLESLDAVGNSETIFFLRNEEQVLFGIDKKQCSNNILILFENNDVKSIDYNNMVTGKTYPPSEFEKLKENDKLLKGFVWRADERPLTKDDIFIKDEELIVPEGKKEISEKIETADLPVTKPVKEKPIPKGKPLPKVIPEN